MGFGELDVLHALINTRSDLHEALKMLLKKPRGASFVSCFGNDFVTATKLPRGFKNWAPKSKPATQPPSIACVDRFLFKRVPEPFRQLHETMLPCQLVCALFCVHAKRSHQPLPPFPPYLHLQFPPRQLQSFLHGCVLFIAPRLSTPPASVFHLVHARTKRTWNDRIFVRIMSAYVAKAMVRRQGVHCDVLCLRAHLLQALASFDDHCTDASCSTCMRTC